MVDNSGEKRKKFYALIDDILGDQELTVREIAEKTQMNRDSIRRWLIELEKIDKVKRRWFGQWLWSLKE